VVVVLPTRACCDPLAQEQPAGEVLQPEVLRAPLGDGPLPGARGAHDDGPEQPGHGAAAAAAAAAAARHTPSVSELVS